MHSSVCSWLWWHEQFSSCICSSPSWDPWQHFSPCSWWWCSSLNNSFSSEFDFSIASTICLPFISSHEVVITVAFVLCSLINETTSSSFSCDNFWVRLSIIVFAFSIWLLKNSPKFFIYILHFCASTTAQKLLSFTFVSSLISSTALITSDNLPTPDGSIIILSGLYWSNASLRALPKSPTREQHIHPEFISVISIPVSFKKPPSIPICPNSFSIIISFSL